MTSQPPNPASVQQKLDARLAIIADLASTLAPNCADVFSILAETERALKRAAKRMESLPGEFERVELVPANGPTIEFSGKMLASQKFDTARNTTRLEIWQTDGGALIALESFNDGRPDEIINVCTPSGEIEDQRLAVMAFFDWSNRARSMARKLGWKMHRAID